MLQTFLTGLREGLEASLIVAIIVAYVLKSGRRDRLSAIWTGAGVAAAGSLAVGAVLTFTSRSLTFQAQEAFGGSMSILAVVLVTSMVFWMKHHAHTIKGQLQARLGETAELGWWAVALITFITVGREGLETALFLWPTIQASGSGLTPTLGAFLGIVGAIVLGWLVYRRSVQLDLARFFRLTGIALIVVAAGVLAYGVHDLQEAAILPGLNDLAFDVSAHVPPTSWYGTVLKGTVNFSPATTWLQAVVYFAYVIPTMCLFLQDRSRPGARLRVRSSAEAVGISR